MVYARKKFETHVRARDFETYVGPFLSEKCLVDRADVGKLFNIITVKKIWTHMKYRPLVHALRRFQISDEIKLQEYSRLLSHHNITKKI